MRDCNPSNQPGTCFWCGAKLRSLSSPRTLARRIERARKLYTNDPGKAKRKSGRSIASGKTTTANTTACSVPIAAPYILVWQQPKNGYRLGRQPKKEQ